MKINAIKNKGISLLQLQVYFFVNLQSFLHLTHFEELLIQYSQFLIFSQLLIHLSLINEYPLLHFKQVSLLQIEQFLSEHSTHLLLLI